MQRGQRLAVGSLVIATSFGGMVLAAGAATAAPATRYVAPNGNDGTEGSNDCTAEATPCKTVQHAIDKAAAGDTVSLAGGTYAEAPQTSKTLTIVGPSNGGGARISDSVSSTGATTTLTLRSVEVSGSKNYGVASQNGAKLVLDDVLVSDNAQAGVLSLDGASVAVTGSRISDNHAGGLFASGAAVSIADSTISDNGTASADAGGIEFGVASFAGSVEVRRSTISGNVGGGVAVVAGETDDATAAAAPADQTATISDSTLAGNSQFGVGVGGGAELTLDTSTITGTKGLGVYTEQSSAVVRNSTISNTIATKLVGEGAPTESAGLYNDNRNTQASAGSTSTPALFRSTTRTLHVGNKTVTLRPHAVAPAAAKGTITVSGTLLAQAGTVKDCVGGVVDSGYNLSADRGNSCAFTAAKHDVVKTSPKLGALAVNGGVTETQLPAAGSAALDRIPAGSAGCTADATDQRGAKRLQGTRCDIGSVERPASALRITTVSLPAGVVGVDYSTTLHATGGADSAYVWSLAPGTSLPAGLKLSAAGVLSGTPTVAGTFAVTVSVNDPVTKRFTLVISAASTSGGGNPISDTGVPTASLTALGAATALLGMLLIIGAGQIGRRPGRHRTAR